MSSVSYALFRDSDSVTEENQDAEDRQAGKREMNVWLLKIEENKVYSLPQK